VTDSPPFGEGFSFININGEKNMDRKLFFSYIQNMQQNNQDMIGFQNSMRKNSWQKPKSIVEMNGGGHVNQAAFDAEDRRRQSNLDAAQQRVDQILNSNSFDTAVKGAHQDLMSDMPGADTVHDWIHDSKGFHSGPGLKQSGEKILGSFDPNIVVDQLPRMGSFSDDEREMLHSGIMDALNKEHNSHMGAQKAAEQHEADQDEIDMQTDVAQKADFFRRQGLQ
jgi:hypothetical protein